MTLRSLCVALATLAASVALAGACSAQPPASDTQKQIDALRAQVTAMQKDLDEIKTLLAPLRAQQAQGQTPPLVDLGNRPFRGAAAAKLTLVELTDYQ
jgi:protein-disulfide isomerase